MQAIYADQAIKPTLGTWLQIQTSLSAPLASFVKAWSAGAPVYKWVSCSAYTYSCGRASPAAHTQGLQRATRIAYEKNREGSVRDDLQLTKSSYVMRL
eukprot:scaffold210385_cov12-Tisochrysis_lutea.AAC.1